MDDHTAGSYASATVPFYPSTGWTCQNCGAWVANGTVHTCTWRNYGSGLTAPVRLTDDEIERIARRVADLLKEGP